MTFRTTWILGLLLTVSCGYRSSTLLDEDGGTADHDAQTHADAGHDAGRTEDAGHPDGGPLPDLTLAEAMSCDLDESSALEAIVRHVACDRATRATVWGAYEAWQAGLFGVNDPIAGELTGFRFDFGCDLWGCLSAATDCAAHDACFAASRSGGPCEPRAERCPGDGTIERCTDDGSGWVSIFDCARIGGACEAMALDPTRATCNVGGCAVSGAVYDFECDGADLTACDGALRLSCSAWRSGTSCRSFAIGGEVPIMFCGPPEFGGAGAYSFPVVCTSGVISFDALQAYDISYDCVAHGYSGCDERGCVP